LEDVVIIRIFESGNSLVYSWHISQTQSQKINNYIQANMRIKNWKKDHQKSGKGDKDNAAESQSTTAAKNTAADKRE